MRLFYRFRNHRHDICHRNFDWDFGGAHRNGLSATACAKLIQSLDKPLVILVAVDQFDQQFFRAREVFLRSVRVRELAERSIETERLTGVTAEIDEQFQWFGLSRRFLTKTR